jgi:hypothetical protein
VLGRLFGLNGLEIEIEKACYNTLPTADDFIQSAKTLHPGIKTMKPGLNNT